MTDVWKVRTDCDNGFWSQVTTTDEAEARDIFRARVTLLSQKKNVHQFFKNDELIEKVES